LFIQSNNIACYFAQEKEFDCESIIKAVWQSQKKCFLPVLSTDQKNFLDFVLYRSNDALRFNRYRILEPINKVKIPSEALDVVIIPLVGFNEKGHRLGMGGGYYDRTFSYINEKKCAKTPFLLGLAYEIQRFRLLPNDVWDVSLDGVLTEEKLYYFS